ACNHKWRLRAFHVCPPFIPPAYRMRRYSAMPFLIALLLAITSVQAQDLEPRSYSNAPVGLNFLIAGYGYSNGTLAFDPALPIADARYIANTEVFAYVRTLDAWGKSAKFDVVLPYTTFSGQAQVNGLPRRRDMAGWN